ncbi:hypothetical protein P4C99_00450 [Pontiellaceae bacterium B1224]|nr:hypothetical protein [Pontiellaceae bacterium B1224]
MKLKKRFFAKHTKSSAALVTLALHALFIVLGLSFVVMSTINEAEPRFINPPVKARENVPLRKLRPPSNARKPKSAQKNFARVPVKVTLEQKVPEIQLPDLQTAKGEIGGSAGTAGDALSTIAFAIPELTIFDVRGKGEKIFLILDADEPMLEDKMGGIPAYTIIKQEMIRIINELPSTAVFNVCVYGRGKAVTLFPNLVSASDSNARKAEEWLRPLNGAEESVRSGRYGIQTLGKGGIEQKQDLRVGRFKTMDGTGDHEYRQDRWFVPAMVAMQQHADTVFLLTNSWGRQQVAREKSRNMSAADWFQSSEGKRWLERVEKANRLFAEENARRKQAGEPPRVIANGRRGLMAAYFPGTPGPPSLDYYRFTPEDFQEAFAATRAAVSDRLSLRKRKNEFTFNVIQFVPADADSGTDARFKKLTRLTRGGYQTVAGLEAIRSYVESE